MTTFLNAIPNDDWETVVSAGIALAQDMDSRRFEMGDLGALVSARYGENNLGKFAAEIGMARVHTLREYVRVARGWERVTRATYLEAGLNWSHFREALRAGDLAEHWLAQAADNGWPVAEMARQISAALGQPVPPRKLFDAEAVVLFAADCTLTLGLDADTPLGEGQKVRVVVYEWNTDLVTGTGRKVEVGA